MSTPGTVAGGVLRTNRDGTPNKRRFPRCQKCQKCQTCFSSEQNQIFLFDFGLLGRKFWVLFGVNPGFVRFGVLFGAKSRFCTGILVLRTKPIVYSEQNLKSDVRNVNTALGVDVPRTKPELPQAGPGWEVRSGGAGGRHPFFGHSTLVCRPEIVPGITISFVAAGLTGLRFG